jgi:hypothetical protein
VPFDEDISFWQFLARGNIASPCSDMTILIVEDDDGGREIASVQHVPGGSVSIFDNLFYQVLPMNKAALSLPSTPPRSD